MQFNWGKKDIWEGETLPADLMQRAKYAEALTNFTKAQSDRPDFVLNIDADWGAGKTYFIKRWANSIKTKHCFVYIDAWKNDYSEDPLMTVISAIYTQLCTVSDTEKSEKLKQAIQLSKRVAPVLIKGLIKKITGCDSDEFSAKSVAADSAEALLSEMLNQDRAQGKAIEEFRNGLELIVEQANSNKGYTAPTYIFIDELDRCRPIFAIEMLEVVKHLFSVKGLVFVVSTDTEQLGHSVKAIYGEGFESRLYLERFFTYSVSLPEPNLREFIANSNFFKSVEEYMEEDGLIFPYGIELQTLLATLVTIISKWTSSLRSVERLLDRLQLSITQVRETMRSVDVLFLTLLIILRDQERGNYEVLTSVNGSKPRVDGIDNHFSKYAARYKDIDIALMIPIQRLHSMGSSPIKRKMNLADLLNERYRILQASQDEINEIEESISEARFSGERNDVESVLYSWYVLLEYGDRKKLTLYDYSNLVKLSSVLN